MTAPTRRIALAALLATLAMPAAARDLGTSGAPSGTITLQSRTIAVGVGLTRGDGVLSFRGRRYPFEIRGITVADVGFSRLSGRGRVYNLKRVEDFAGTYAASTGEVTAGRGRAGQALVNGAGVQIRVDNITRGAELAGSADGIQVTLK